MTQTPVIPHPFVTPQPCRAAGAIVLLVVAASLAGCADFPRTREPYPPPEKPVTRPTEGPATPPARRYRTDVNYPRRAEEISGPAVLSLLEQSRKALAQGRAEQAVAACETALDIEKRNPFVWQQLARAHLAHQRPEDAEIVAHRSNSFANGNPYIEVENWRVIAQSRQARGDAAGVQQARDRLAVLEDLLND